MKTCERNHRAITFGRMAMQFGLFCLTANGVFAAEPLTIITGSLPDGLVNAVYLAGFLASGGTPPYTWEIASGSLPPGLSLTSNGTLTGKPTSSGSFSFTVRAKEADPGVGSTTKSFTLTVNNPVPAITGMSPSSAIAGGPGFTLTVNGSNFVSGTTVRWNGSDRTSTLSGANELTASIPASDIVSAGPASVTVNNPGPGGGTSNALSFTITPPLTITTGATLPDGLLNAAYSQTLSASGGTPPYTWDITSGSLPPGLSLGASNGTLSGTPISSGTFSFAVRVQDSSQPTAASKTKTFTLTVSNPVPAITGMSPSSAIAGGPGFTLTVNGSNFVSGTTVRWNGSDRTSTLSGAKELTASIPASDIVSAGPASVTVNNPGPGGGTSNALSFTISSPLAITTGATLPDGLLNAAYSQTLSASGGTPPYTWDITSGSLPPGLSLAASNGTLSGTPISSGTFSFAVRVQDSAQPTAASKTKTFTLTVSNPVPSISGINPSSADAGDPGFALTVNGSNFVSGATVRWNGSDRTTTFNSATKLTASIPASDIVSAGTASITVNNPSPGGGLSNALSFTISPPPAPPPLTITSSSPLPDGVVAAPYSQTLSASGGTPPYQWSVSSGSLPPGLSLTPGTGVLSGTPSAAGDFHFALQVSDGTQPTRNTVTQTFNLRINTPVPTILGLNPSSANAGDSGFTLTVIGSNFTEGSTVLWNGVSRSTSFTSSSQLTSSISAGDIAVVGTAIVAVRNPSPGGGTSNPLTFLISRFVAPLTITSSPSLPNGLVGSAYSQTLSASGGTSPYTWSILAGSLPTGLTLSSSAGTISGTTSVSGTFNFTVRVSDSLSVAADKSFQLLIKPQLPAISITGPTDPLAPAQQPTVEISLAETYPSLLSGQMTLTFTPDADVPSDDPAIQFSTGGRAVAFTIPANSLKALFPNSATSIAFQSGTVAGTIKISIAMQSEGTDVTPSPTPSQTFTMNRMGPSISRLSIASRTPSGFDIEIVGFSTPRSLTQVVFQFTPRAGSNLGTSTSTVPLGSSSATWFQSDTSKQFGSLFRLVIPFAVQGDVNAIQSVSATLTNDAGTSDILSTNL